jgi:plastocyanin
VRSVAVLVLLAWAISAVAEENPHAGHAMSSGAHHGHDMTLNVTGMVMNANTSELPRGCTELGRDYEFTVYAGVEFASRHPGTVFGMSRYDYQVEPCSRVTVTFINNDAVRHQWMLHGLPRYLYPQGMFHLEAAGGAQQTGTFIVPSDDRTYLVHCDMAQHMENGMKGQLKVGAGSGNLWAVPGVSASFYPDSYLPSGSLRWIAIALLTGICLVIVLARLVREA